LSLAIPDPDAVTLFRFSVLVIVAAATAVFFWVRHSRHSKRPAPRRSPNARETSSEPQASDRDGANPQRVTDSRSRSFRLVAEGKTNRDVAAILFVSPKTVEFHLTRVYRKLDIGSRTELVRRLVTEETPR